LRAEHADTRTSKDRKTAQVFVIAVLKQFPLKRANILKWASEDLPTFSWRFLQNYGSLHLLHASVAYELLALPVFPGATHVCLLDF